MNTQLSMSTAKRYDLLPQQIAGFAVYTMEALT